MTFEGWFEEEGQWPALSFVCADEFKYEVSEAGHWRACLKGAFEAGYNSCIDDVVNVRSRCGDYVEIHVEDLEEMKK
tara:strand:+ start:153 stop:383 length:231 start_codon:yes stop_codon:yes gene_type:complete